MIRKLTEKIGGGWLFLISVCLLYVIIGLFDFQMVRAGLLSFSGLLLKILPILVTVFGLLFLSNLLIQADTISRFLGRGSKSGGWIVGKFGGNIIGALKERGIQAREMTGTAKEAVVKRQES